jgi:hypothetical protein
MFRDFSCRTQDVFLSRRFRFPRARLKKLVGDVIRHRQRNMINCSVLVHKAALSRGRKYLMRA